MKGREEITFNIWVCDSISVLRFEEFDAGSAVRSVLGKFSACTGVDCGNFAWSVNGMLVRDFDLSFSDLGLNARDVSLIGLPASMR